MKLILVLCLSLSLFPVLLSADESDTDKKLSTVPVSERSLAVRKKQLGTVTNPGPLTIALKARGFSPGDHVFIRIFKQVGAPIEDLKPVGKGVLEVWLQKKSSKTFSLFKTYQIAAFSGELGPKLREGDRQAPEGFYGLIPASLNPNSSYHLSMNVGYPNDFDLEHGRTGSYIMIHGSSLSIGCFAMTNPLIEEIYILAEAAFLNKQSRISVHIFPFPVTSDNLVEAAHLQWLAFWQNLKDGHDFFENQRIVPHIQVVNGEYVVTQNN